MAREEGKQRTMMPGHFPCGRSSPVSPQTASRCSSVRLVSEGGPSHWSKSTVFPFVELLQIRGGSNKNALHRE